MWQIIGWIIWIILVFLVFSFAFGCRSYAKSGRGFQWTTGTQTLFLLLITILFLKFDWNKLHILWIAPSTLFLAQLTISGGVPILSPLILFFTRMFLNVILIGIKKSNSE